MGDSSRRGRAHSPLMRAVAWLLLAVFASSCTRQVPRDPLETRTFTVEWERLDATRVAVGAMTVDGIVLTPAQWPLEASIKKLLQGDFAGVVENFDLRFRGQSLDDEVLRKLFDAGFLPAYLRVRNEGEAPALFDPGVIVAIADGATELYPVTADELPAYLEEIDWERMGTAMVVVVLAVLLAVMARDSGKAKIGRTAHVTVRVNSDLALGSSARGSGRGEEVAAPSDAALRRGLLSPVSLRPGETREGFLFFRLDRTVADWNTVHIAAP